MDGAPQTKASAWLVLGSTVVVLALMTACVTSPSGSSGVLRSSDCPEGSPMTALPEPRVRGVRDPDNWRSVGHSAVAAWVVEFAGAVETRSPGSGGLDMDAAQASVSVDGVAVVVAHLKRSSDGWKVTELDVCQGFEVDPFDWTAPACGEFSPTGDYEGSPEAPSGPDSWDVVASFQGLDDGQLLVLSPGSFTNYLIIDRGELVSVVSGGGPQTGEWEVSGATECLD